MYEDPAPVFGPMFRDFMVGFFYGSVFYQLSDGTEDYVSRLSLIFFSLLLQMMGQMDNISMMMEDRLMFYRERGAQAYGPTAYWVSLWIPQMPMLFMNTLLFCTSLYPLSGLRTDSSDKFGYFFFILLLTSYAAMLGAFTVCSIAESTQAALSFFPMFLVFNIVYSGYLIVLPDLPAWQGDWLPYACMCRYCFQGLVLNEFQNNEKLQFRTQLINMEGFESISINGCIGLLFLMIGIYGSGLLAALTYIDFEQR
jgi:ABC-type multidrug transport system permease subunit